MSRWWSQPSTPDALQSWLADFLADTLQRKGLADLLSDPLFHVSAVLSDPRAYGFTSLDMISMASRVSASMGLDRTGLSDLLLARRSFDGWVTVLERSLRIDDAQIGFYSSGSTGSPVLSRHTLNDLQLEASHFAGRLSAITSGKPQRVVSAVPCHHIYGFIWGVLLPAALDVPLIRIRPQQSLPASWASQLQEADVLVATPEIWALIMELDIRLPARFTGVSSTAPMPPELSRRIRQTYPEASLLEVYGSTETAGIAVRDQDSAGFELLPHWELKQQQGYLLQHQASGHQHTLNDAIEVLEDGRTITVNGRLDDTVQINGHNVHLPTLAERLCSHPQIREAHVQVGTDSTSARLLHYFLIPDCMPDDSHTWCAEFTEWMRVNLGNVAPPASVIIGESLPRSTLGKPLTWQPDNYKPLTGIYRKAARSTVSHP